MSGLKRLGKANGIFIVKIAGLTSGSHQHTCKVKADDFNDPDITAELFPNDIDVDIILHKSHSEIVADITVAAYVKLECDLCLRPVERLIEGSYKVFFLFEATGLSDNDDDVRVIDKTASEIDLYEDVRETMLLAVPIKNVCEDTTTCQQHLKKNQSVTYTRVEASSETEEESDAEWKKALREIENKLKSN